MHRGQGIFDHRMFGNKGVFGSQLPTEHLDPSRPRPIGPAPGQVVQVANPIPVQGTMTALDPVSQYARAVLMTRAPNFPAGAVYPTGTSVPVTRMAGALLPVSNVARAAIPVGRERQVFEGFGQPPRVLHVLTGIGQPPRVLHPMAGFRGFGNPDGLGGLIGFG